jgi:hypothetical protein
MVGIPSKAVNLRQHLRPWRSPVRKDTFGVQWVRTRAKFSGFPDRFDVGTLPKIAQALNAHEVFESSSSTERRFLSLEGENWDCQIDPSEIVVTARGFRDCHDIQEGVSFFLGELREALAEDYHFHFYADNVIAAGPWPLDKVSLRGAQRSMSAGSILRSRALKLTESHLQHLPGDLLGAGVKLVGKTDGYLWTIDAGPSRPDQLTLSADLMFLEPEPSDWPSNEIEAVTENIATAYSFLEDDLTAFVGAFMP